MWYLYVLVLAWVIYRKIARLIIILLLMVLVIIYFPHHSNNVMCFQFVLNWVTKRIWYLYVLVLTCFIHRLTSNWIIILLLIVFAICYFPCHSNNVMGFQILFNWVNIRIWYLYVLVLACFIHRLVSNWSIILLLAVWVITYFPCHSNNAMCFYFRFNWVKKRI